MNNNIFTEKDYNSSNGMSTSIWGPLKWNSLHITSFNYPVNPTKEDKKNYKQLISNLQNVLPCKVCRINIVNNLKKVNFNDGVFENRYTFSFFIYRLHNCVNKMLGKTIRISYEEVRDRYEHFRSRCNDSETGIKNNIKKEKNCNSSLRGIKSKSVIRIVPNEKIIEGFKIDTKCKVKKSKKK
jgi:hypothetical protein